VALVALVGQERLNLLVEEILLLRCEVRGRGGGSEDGSAEDEGGYAHIFCGEVASVD